MTRRIITISLAVPLLALTLCACESSPGGVANKVMQDFGLKKRPEGYVSESDKVFQRLPHVGESEMKRMNLDNQHGEVKFQRENDLKGWYYKEVKVFENFFPLEAQPVSHTSESDRGYQGYIEYEYRIYQGARKDTRAAAAAESASIPTDETGRETYRYTFGSGGTWNSQKGSRVKD